MQRFLKIFLAITVLLLPLAAFATGSEEKKPPQEVHITIGNDFFAAGANVDLSQGVEDDAFLVGATVNISGKVGGDLTAAGSNLTITGDVGDDLRAAGSNLVVTGNVVGSALLAGANVSVSNSAAFGAASKVAGGVVNFAGEVVGDLDLAGGVVNYSGSTDGDLKIIVDDELVISPDAKVSGKLTYTAKKQIEIPAGIAKEVVYLPKESKDAGKSGIVSALHGFDLVSKLFGIVIFFITGMAMLALLGKASVTMAEVARKKIWQVALTGALLFILPLFLGLILLATGVGSIVGVFVLLTWIILLLSAAVLSGYFIGSFILKQTTHTSFGKKLLALLLGLVIGAVVSFIPHFGGMLGFLVFVYSVGVVALSKLQLYKAAKTAKLL
jgi:cytoskeletal protein CcmA (bactofilin family)